MENKDTIHTNNALHPCDTCDLMGNGCPGNIGTAICNGPYHM